MREWDVAALIGRGRSNADIAERRVISERTVESHTGRIYDKLGCMPRSQSTTFDVVHDAVDPTGLLRSSRQALKPDGVFVCLEIDCADRLEDNVGPLAALFHAISVLLHDHLACAWLLRFHHRKVESWRWRGRYYLQRWPSDRAMNSIRSKVRQATDQAT
jgi:DNA-binding CsgD family transcriptional regulator